MIFVSGGTIIQHIEATLGFLKTTAPDYFNILKPPRMISENDSITFFQHNKATPE